MAKRKTRKLRIDTNDPALALFLDNAVSEYASQQDSRFFNLVLKASDDAKRKLYIDGMAENRELAAAIQEKLKALIEKLQDSNTND